MGLNPLLKQQAIKLRLEGKSYTTILRQLDLKSKGTLSVWFRDLKLPPRTKALLKANTDRAAERGFMDFNRRRTARIRAENEAAYQNGLSEIGPLSNRELLLVGAALYWGEGTKLERKHGSISLVFTNSDPQMIRTFLSFLRIVMQIEDGRIRSGIHLYNKNEIHKSRKYWAAVTKLPADRFYISTLVSRASTGKRDKRRLPYGTLVLRINSRTVFYRVKGMMAGIAAN